MRWSIWRGNAYGACVWWSTGCSYLSMAAPPAYCISPEPAPVVRTGLGGITEDCPQGTGPVLLLASSGGCVLIVVIFWDLAKDTSLAVFISSILSNYMWIGFIKRDTNLTTLRYSHRSDWHFCSCPCLGAVCWHRVPQIDWMRVHSCSA